jgi:hypothetical protein
MATINLNDAMAWLKKMEERSNINQQRFEARPSVPASQAWSGYQDKPGGQRLMVRQMQRPEIDNTLTVKNDGTQTLVKKWKDPDRSNVKATALPPEPVMSPGRELLPGRANPMWSAQPLDPSRWGGQRGQIENPMVGGMMWKDPSWLGVPQARAAPAPRRVQPRVSDPMNTRPGTVGGSLHHPANIVNLGPPRVADLRNRVREIDRQQFAIPRQQMPPPRFVPRVDPSQFPTVQDRNTGTYNLGDPGVQMGGGFDWSGQALRENVGEDLRGIWSPIKERMDKILEDIRKRREGQTMAPFDWRNN